MSARADLLSDARRVLGDAAHVVVSRSPKGGTVVNVGTAKHYHLQPPHVRVWAKDEDAAIDAARAALESFR